MKNDHTVNSNKGIPEFAYISFEDALNIAKTINQLKSPFTFRDISNLTGRKKTGWFGLQIASLKRWGLLTGRGEMKLTDGFRKVLYSKNSLEIINIKKEAFMNIGLFKEIFDKYYKKGLLDINQLTNVLESEYKINKTYAPLVAKVINFSISEYFQGYNISKLNDNLIIKNKTNEIDNIHIKNVSFSVNIISPVGKFIFEASNKSEAKELMKTKLTKIWDTIDQLWEEKRDEITKKNGEKDNVL